MPYKMNPGVIRERSVFGAAFTAVIANSLLCSAACAARRKLVRQRARRLARSADSFVDRQPGSGS